MNGGDTTFTPGGKLPLPPCSRAGAGHRNSHTKIWICYMESAGTLVRFRCNERGTTPICRYRTYTDVKLAAVCGTAGRAITMKGHECVDAESDAGRGMSQDCRQGVLSEDVDQHMQTDVPVISAYIISKDGRSQQSPDEREAGCVQHLHQRSRSGTWQVTSKSGMGGQGRTVSGCPYFL